jgi:hypothetical protein
VNPIRRLVPLLAALPLLLMAGGCSERNPLELDEARAPSDPLVFDDALSDDVYFQAFLDTYVEAVRTDSVFAYGGAAVDGARSLQITVPPQGSSLGIYSGGVLTASGSRDLADFNALTFYARSDQLIQMDVLGFGNDNTGTSLYEAGRANVVLNRDWTFVVIPIPDPAKLIAERGLFTFAEAPDPRFPQGHHVWVDELRYARLGNVTDPQPSMPEVDAQYFVGATVSLAGTRTTFDVDGAPVAVDHMPGYFDFASSDEAVARVTEGRVVVVGPGNAEVTAVLGEIPVTGGVAVTAFAPPTATAPVPTHPAGEVISMFSDAYADVPVDAWNTFWQFSTAQVEDYRIGDNTTKMYSTLNFVGIEFLNPTIDASQMNFFHLDVFAPSGTNFKVKLVAFNENGGFAGETQELTFDATTTPAFTAGQWCALDIPLEDFQLPVSWEHMGQLVLATDDAQLVLVDNVYWHP